MVTFVYPSLGLSSKNALCTTRSFEIGVEDKKENNLCLSPETSWSLGGVENALCTTRSFKIGMEDKKESGACLSPETSWFLGRVETDQLRGSILVPLNRSTRRTMDKNARMTRIFFMVACIPEKKPVK